MKFKIFVDNFEINRAAVKGGIKEGRPAEIIRLSNNVDSDYEVFVKDQSYPGIGRVSLGLVSQEDAKEIQRIRHGLPKIDGRIISIESDKALNGTKSIFYFEIGP